MKNSKGFTLVELLTVIAIIGILAAVITVSTTSARKQARDAKRKSDLNAISGSLEMYYAQKREYPEQSSPGAYDAFKGVLSVLIPNYISSLPEDPLNKDQFRFYYFSEGKAYILDVGLESDETTDSNCKEWTWTTGFQTAVCDFNGGLHYRVTNK